jgi:hypothetical protein
MNCRRECSFFFLRERENARENGCNKAGSAALQSSVTGRMAAARS